MEAHRSNHSHCFLMGSIAAYQDHSATWLSDRDAHGSWTGPANGAPKHLGLGANAFR